MGQLKAIVEVYGVGRITHLVARKQKRRKEVALESVSLGRCHMEEVMGVGRMIKTKHP